MMDAQHIRDILWAKAEPALYISRDQFMASLDGWRMEVLGVADAPAFVFLIKGPEFHFDTLGTGLGAPMKKFREIIQAIIDEHGYATTRAPIDDTKQQKLNRIFGFVETRRDHLDVHFRIEKFAKHFSERRAECQQ